jgi:PPOX class probable F420-dependent enzyme
VAYDPTDLPAPAQAFLAERILATLTTLRPDGTPHVVPVGFTWDAATATARVITSAGSVKARNLAEGGRAALCQVDGGRWLTLEGRARVSDDPDVVADAVQRYQARYRPPRRNPERVAVLVAVDRVLGRVPAT